MLDLTVGDHATLVTCRRGGDPEDLVVRAVPDHRAARRLQGTLRRVSWVSLDLTGPAPVCRIAGVRRRPVRFAVPVAVGLALIDDGAPAVVRSGGGAAR